jgi:hypothetical protein
MLKTIVIILIGIAAVALGAWYFLSPQEETQNSTTLTTNDSQTVATVNGEEITRGTLNTFKTNIIAQQGVDISMIDAETQAQLDAQLIHELIAQELVRQAVSASGIIASNEAVDSHIAAIVDQLGSEEAYDEALIVGDLSRDEFRLQVVQDLSTQAYFEQELQLSAVTATSEEIEESYAGAVAQSESIPPLDEIRSEVEQSVIQQKQQVLLGQHIEMLRENADVKILL